VAKLSLPEHTSHSARETLERCARAYFLSRVAKAPARPALWLAGGSAVHEVTEAYDRLAFRGKEAAFSAATAWDAAFDAQVAKAFEREPDF
jgi:putative RecB family exonuclease